MQQKEMGEAIRAERRQEQSERLSVLVLTGTYTGLKSVGGRGCSPLQMEILSNQDHSHFLKILAMCA